MSTITYEDIIKYLMPKLNTFSLQPNITMANTLFTDIFDDSFYRFGVIILYESHNISLKSSILCCIYSQYNSMSSKDIYSFDMPTNITELCNLFKINIIFFNYNMNHIQACYRGDFFNPWIPTIYIATDGEWYEPIIMKDLKIFSFSSQKSNILKNNILCKPINIYNTTENININDNFNEILEIDNFVKSIQLNETFITSESIIPNKTKLEKMKKDELFALCAQLNKVINVSKPTKKDIIDIIYTQ